MRESGIHGVNGRSVLLNKGRGGDGGCRVKIDRDQGEVGMSLGMARGVKE